MSNTEERFALHRRDPVTGQLERVPATERIDAILSMEHTREVVRAMDPQTLFSLIREAGIEDAQDLLLLTSASQQQAFMDLDCWRGDALELPQVSHWLEQWLQLDDKDFAAWLAEVDPELPVVWMREQCAVFLWEEDRDLLDTIDGAVSTSPDGVYAILIPDEERIGILVRHFMERVYATDLRMGQQILEAVRWEMSADLMERAYQAHSGRLLDLGFAPPEEAIEVYAWLDPIQWRDRTRKRILNPDTPPIILTQSGQLPPVDSHLQVLEAHQARAGESFFFRSMAAIPRAYEREKVAPIADAVFSQLRAVTNRVHIADGALPGDIGFAETALVRAIAHLTIGLEQVCNDDPVLGARALATVPLKLLHRIGYATLLDLQKKAREIVKRGNVSLTDAPTSLLEESDQDLVGGLLLARPRPSAMNEGRFENMEEVKRAAARLSRIAVIELILCELLGLRRDDLAALAYDETRCASPVEFISASGLLITRLLQDESSEEGVVSPIPLERLNEFLRTAGTREARRLALAQRSMTLIEGFGVPKGPVREAVQRAFGDAITDFLEAVGEAPVERTIATTLLLVAPAH